MAYEMRKRNSTEKNKGAEPSRRWSRRSNVVWQCCNDRASSWSAALDSGSKRTILRKTQTGKINMKDTTTYFWNTNYMILLAKNWSHIGTILVILRCRPTLNLLSCRTFLMATISWLSIRRAWYTTPNDPLPITCKASAKSHDVKWPQNVIYPYGWTVIRLLVRFFKFMKSYELLLLAVTKSHQFLKKKKEYLIYL